MKKMKKKKVMDAFAHICKINCSLPPTKKKIKKLRSNIFMWSVFKIEEYYAVSKSYSVFLKREKSTTQFLVKRLIN